MGATDEAHHVEAFIDAFASASSLPTGPRVALGAALSFLIARAKAAWPGIVVDGVCFIRYVASRLHAGGDALEQLGSLDAGGMYIACACVGHDGSAIERCVATLGPQVDRALAQMGLAKPEREDVVATLQQLLFFGDEAGSEPILGSYTGRGSLQSWARSVGVKQAFSLRRREHRYALLDDELFDLPADQTTPEMAYLRHFYLEEFRAAFQRAIRAIPKRERNLLKQHYLDGMSLDAVARVHRVHRATAARWLADARQSALDKTRQELTGAVHLSPSEVDSVLTFVRRQSSFGDDIARIKGPLAGG